MNCKKCSLLTATGLILVAATTPARADFIDGTAWSVPPSTAGNTPTLGNTPGPGATELATFTANGINFSGDAPGAYSIGGFLASGGTVGTINYMKGATGATNLDNTLWEFTGFATFTTGESFNVVHDDGVNLYVGGNLVLSDPGPTAPILSTYTYTGVSGTQSFDFIYTECCGGTADFQTTLVPTGPGTPEPGTLVLIGLGGAILVTSYRRRTANSN